VNVSCSYYHSLVVAKENESSTDTTVYAVGRNDSG